MPRRAKTSLSPFHFLIMLAAVAVVSLAGYALLNRSTEGSYTGVAELSLRDYLQNSNALSNNTYRMEGLIDERLDNWRSDQGRLFSVLIEDGGDTAPVPVLIPEKFNRINVQRGQRYRFKVTVQAGTGILQADDITKA